MLINKLKIFLKIFVKMSSEAIPKSIPPKSDALERISCGEPVEPSVRMLVEDFVLSDLSEFLSDPSYTLSEHSESPSATVPDVFAIGLPCPPTLTKKPYLCIV